MILSWNLFHCLHDILQKKGQSQIQKNLQGTVRLQHNLTALSTIHPLAGKKNIMKIILLGMPPEL